MISFADTFSLTTLFTLRNRKFRFQKLDRIEKLIFRRSRNVKDYTQAYRRTEK